VVLPVYNQERFITQAIESMLAQTFTDFELIVVDDGSTDRTVEMLRRFDDSRIRCITAPHRGFIKSLVRGYEEARGSWIARMDSDDLSHPARLARQMEFLEAHPECAFVGTAYGFLTPNGYCLEPSTQFDWRYVTPWDITIGRRVFADPTVVFHRETAERVGYHDPEFENENPLWYRLIECSKGAVLGEPLYLARWMIGSLSRTGSRRLTEDHLRIRFRYDPENAAKLRAGLKYSAKKTLEKNLKKGMGIYLRAGDRAAALGLAWLGWTSWPFSAVRTKLLLYAILGIEGIRVARVRAQTKRFLRRPNPLLAHQKAPGETRSFGTITR
jgi:glycosyltransferase involved in cell wall biosynthesis